MIAPSQEDQPVIEELSVYEWVQFSRQPIDSQVDDAIAKLVVKIEPAARWYRRLARYRGLLLLPPLAK